jgi:acetylornithine deacetylase
MTNEKRCVQTWVREHRDDCVELLSNLVRIPSENHVVTGDELDCQRYVETTWREMGLEIDTFEPDALEIVRSCAGFLPGRSYMNRPDVVGRLAGKSGGKRVMMTAHIDVVPAGENSLWVGGDPWSGDVRDGKLFGRGSADDKSGVAAMTMAVRALQECGFRLKNELVLASVVDEESGGANGALAAVLKYPCDYYLNIDGFHDVYSPVSLSGGRFRIDVETKGCNPCARNVLDALMILYEELRSIERIKKEEFFSKPIFCSAADELDVFRVMEMYAGDEEDVTQSNVGVIKAYVYSTEDKETNRRQIEEIIDHAYARMDQSKVYRPKLEFYRRFFRGARTSPTEPLVQFCLANHRLASDRPAKLAAASISDQALIAEFGGGVTIGLGASPHPNEENTFHQANEAVAIEDYLTLIQVLAMTALDLETSE